MVTGTSAQGETGETGAEADNYLCEKKRKRKT